MPFYEYECKACKYYTEVMQKITDAPLSKCPSCGKRALKKLVSAPVFRLKGAGWYETDFKSDKENKRNLLGSEKDEPKPESKPETKAEGKDAKPAVKDGQDGKDVKEVKDVKDSAPAKDKAAGPKAAGAATRRSVSVAARGGAAGRRAGRAAAKSARKRRR
ncbi:MAG TPA: zinc ribbon domain-containing protein [Steroidobacteraceae bacterium]|jgi:putative FmdB family regulatory protein|nr:zinc ribbon domain-containing protein [Steroidobacteraceae bacterium]